MIRGNHEDPATWGPVRRLCDQLLDDLATIAASATSTIRAAQPAYAAVPEAEHRATVAEQLRHRLDALAEQRGLDESELLTATDLAAARSAAGIPIDALIAAYQEGDRVIWRLVVERSTPDMAPLLPVLGSLMFDAISDTTTAMATAHMRVARAIDGSRIALAYQLLEFLGDRSLHPAASVVATRLGLDPSGRFVGLACVRPGDADEVDVQDLTAALRSESVDVVGRVVAGGGLEMIAQVGGDLEPVSAYVAAHAGLGRWGVGVARSGLAGAAESLTDARLALRVTHDGHPIAWFHANWLEAVILAERARYAELLTDAIDTARGHPHLAETVLAFAEADMSIARTAQAVHLHANSVTYRLDRWSQLSGHDARGFAGLVKSVVACRLVELGG